MKAPTHVVLRVIPSSEGDVLAGTLVDASAWANCRLLEGSGHIRLLGPGELAEISGGNGTGTEGKTDKGKSKKK